MSDTMPLLFSSLIVIIALCLPSCSSDDSDSGTTNEACATAVAAAAGCSVKTEEILPEDYRPKLGEDGMVKDLKGYQGTKHGVANNTVTPQIITQHAEEPIFEYSAPPDTVPAFSQPVMIAGAQLTDFNLDIKDCTALTYSPAPPKMKSLPTTLGCYGVCIRIWDSKQSAITYIKIPPIVVEAGN